MGYRSNAAAVTRGLAIGIEAGLVRGGAVIADAVRDNLRGGYTTGDFVTGANVNSVYVTPVTSNGGARTIVVTTRLTDPNYPAFWEGGHTNIFAGGGSPGPRASSIASRREGVYLRVPKWAPALEEKADEATALVAAALETSLNAVGTALTISVRSSVRRGPG